MARGFALGVAILRLTRPWVRWLPRRYIRVLILSEEASSKPIACEVVLALSNGVAHRTSGHQGHRG